MSTDTYRLDRDELLRAMTGREDDVLRAVGLTDDQLSGSHKPCPRCGGTDRFRYDRQGKWCICSQCFSSGNGDILAAVQWLTGCDFPEALRIAAEAVGYIPPTNGNGTPSAPRKRTPTERLEAVARLKGIPGGAEALRRYGADVPEDDPRVAIPCIDPSGQVCSFLRVDDKGEKRYDQGKPSGLFLPVTWANGMTPNVTLPRPGETWVIHEGAFDPATTGQLGYLAAGLPTSKMNPKFAALFMGVTCIIVADRDEPGHTGAEQTAANLAGVAKAVKVVHLPPFDKPLPASKGNDIRDVLRQWGEPMVRRILDDAIADLRPDTGIVSIADLIADDAISEHEPILDGIIRRGETALLVASSKVGKTWFAMAMALSVATGRAFLGTWQATRGRVLYVDNELHPGSFKGRFQAVQDALDIRPAEYTENFDYISLRGNISSLPELAGSLFSELDPGKYDLIVLDALYRLYPEGFSENDNAMVTQLFNRLDQLSHYLDTAFVCVHHASKGSQGEKSVTDVSSGAGALSRAPDNVIVLRDHESADEQNKVVVMESRPRSFRDHILATLRWCHPGWMVDRTTDPVLKKSSNRVGRTVSDDQRDIERMVELLTARGPLTKGAIRSELSVSDATVTRLVRVATGQALRSDPIQMKAVIQISPLKGQRGATQYECINEDQKLCT